jgi:hypothetical protein
MDKQKVTINTEEFLSLARKYRHSTTMNADGQFTGDVVDSYVELVTHIDERLNELVWALEIVDELIRDDREMSALDAIEAALKKARGE